jgi:hypothetical protein
MRLISAQEPSANFRELRSLRYQLVEFAIGFLPDHFANGIKFVVRHFHKIFESRRPSMSQVPASRNEVHQHHYDRDHQQNMDEPAERITAHETQ